MSYVLLCTLVFILSIFRTFCICKKAVNKDNNSCVNRNWFVSVSRFPLQMQTFKLNSNYTNMYLISFDFVFFILSVNDH